MFGIWFELITVGQREELNGKYWISCIQEYEAFLLSRRRSQRITHYKYSVYYFGHNHQDGGYDFPFCTYYPGIQGIIHLS